MKILLDHSAPMNLARCLTGHEVWHTTQLGWGELVNGELLKAAEGDGFQLIITADKNIPQQQQLDRCKLALLELSTNNWPLMKGYISDIVQAVEQIKPCQFLKVFCGVFIPRRFVRPPFH